MILRKQGLRDDHIFLIVSVLEVKLANSYLHVTLVASGFVEAQMFLGYQFRGRGVVGCFAAL